MNVKRIIYSTLLLLIPYIGHSAIHKKNPLLDWFFNNLLFVLAAMVIIGVFTALWNLADSIIDEKINEFKDPTSNAKTEPHTSVLKKWYKKAWNLVPMEKETDIDLGHEYDGIRELDNSLPPWWLYTFYLTIIWACGYLYIYHFSEIGHDQKTEYAIAMEKAEREMWERLSDDVDVIDEKNVVFTDNPEALALGKTLFIKSCATCHGNEGQGGVGPNLTDNFWIHGGSIKDIFKTIKYGVPQKGMIAWKSQLKPGAMKNLASYIKTLKGTNPPNPKDAQGLFYEEEQVVQQITEAEENN